MNLFSRKPKRSRYDIPLDAEDNVKTPRIYNEVTINSNFNDWVTYGLTSAGQIVNEKTAMAVSAVYACVNKIGGAIASMPLGIYQRDGDSRKSIKNNIWWLLNEQPCPEYSSATFWESIIASALLHGDGFAVIKRGAGMNTNAIVGLEWHSARRVQVRRVIGQITYTITDLNGNTTSYLPQDILHFTGPGFDGLRGMSQIQYALRSAAGIALAADQYSGAFFENGARPDFAIVHPGNPTQEQTSILRQSWKDRHTGANNAHLPAVLAGGMDVKELTMNAEDSQLIQTRQFQIEDIARIFGVPPHMIGHTQASTSWGTGIEQMSIAFVKFTLMRHMTVIEKELNRKLWPNNPNLFAEFNPSGLERGDYQTRMNGYRVSVGRAGEPGWMTINEIRQLENLPPIDGGDQLFTGVTPNASQSTDQSTST